MVLLVKLGLRMRFAKMAFFEAALIPYSGADTGSEPLDILSSVERAFSARLSMESGMGISGILDCSISSERASAHSFSSGGIFE